MTSPLPSRSSRASRRHPTHRENVRANGDPSTFVEKSVPKWFVSFQEFADDTSPQKSALALRVAMSTLPSSLSAESANTFMSAFREVLKKRRSRRIEEAETAKALKRQQANEREEAMMRVGNERAKRRKAKDGLYPCRARFPHVGCGHYDFRLFQYYHARCTRWSMVSLHVDTDHTGRYRSSVRAKRKPFRRGCDSGQ